MDDTAQHKQLISRLTDAFGQIDDVVALGVGGSYARGSFDRSSDIDLYIFSGKPINPQIRKAVIEKLGTDKADLNLTFWDTGDEWYDLETGIEVDAIYWDVYWISGQIHRNLRDFQGSVGFSTCFWHTLKQIKILKDDSGWLFKLKTDCNQDFPEALRKDIIAKNHPLLRNIIPSYFNQISKAVIRDDGLSINHRLAAFFASYFDVLFALNGLTHPGEKQMLKFALENCRILPDNLAEMVPEILGQSLSKPLKALDSMNILIENLDNILLELGINPADTLSLSS